MSRPTEWKPDGSPGAGLIARDFLIGELEILKLGHVRSSAIVELHVFLEAVGGAELQVFRGPAGDLLVGACGEALLITGRTAQVLRGYLDEEPVTMQDRFDMTQRFHVM